MDAKKLTRRALMLSLALCLSYLESLLPLTIVPTLPGIKLGLANIVTLIALYALDAGSAFEILLLRALLGSIFAGNVSALLFSLSGGMFALLVMAIAGRMHMLSIYGVSVLGAAAHGAGQIFAAMLLMHTTKLGAYLCCLLLAALPSGMATGCMAAAVLQIALNMKGSLEV